MNVCIKCCASLSSRCFTRWFKTLTCWWRYEWKDRIAKVIKIHPLCTMDIYAKIHGNPSNSYWDISLKNKNINLARGKVRTSPKSVGFILCIHVPTWEFLGIWSKVEDKANSSILLDCHTSYQLMHHLLFLVSKSVPTVMSSISSGGHSFISQHPVKHTEVSEC